jgi:hypothetical protein
MAKAQSMPERLEVALAAGFIPALRASHIDPRCAISRDLQRFGAPKLS